jgi:DDE_Tnp_1-associated/Transposase DDE domain
MSPLTLVEVLAEVPDPRGFHGRIHPLPAVLGLVALALLMGRKSLAGVARFGRQYGFPLAQALGFRRGKTPSLSTLSRTLRRLDAEALEAIFGRWIRSRLDIDPELISLDGKTLRGSRDGEIPGQHLVAAYAPAVQAVLAQIRVDAKTNEHKAALQLLGVLPLKNKVVIGDAMFCQRDLAEQVITEGGDYVLFAKDNQPGLEADIKAGFGFETAARSIAAATSPSGPSCACAVSRARGEHDRARTWPNGEANVTDDHGFNVASEVEGFEAGLRVEA